MAKAKQEIYTKVEQEWLEKKLKQLEAYIDAHPIEEMEDRIETVTSSKGQPVVKIIAKREDAVKGWINALKDYAVLLISVELMREKTATSSMEFRGGTSINGMMKDHLNIEDDK